MFVMYSINLANFISGMPLLLEVLGNMCIVINSFIHRKRPPGSVPWKRCSENMQQIYPCQNAISIKLLCNFIEIALRHFEIALGHGCSPVIHCIFSEHLFNRTSLDGCFCIDAVFSNAIKWASDFHPQFSFQPYLSWHILVQIQQWKNQNHACNLFKISNKGIRKKSLKSFYNHQLNLGHKPPSPSF